MRGEEKMSEPLASSSFSSSSSASSVLLLSVWSRIGAAQRCTSLLLRVDHALALALSLSLFFFLLRVIYFPRKSRQRTSTACHSRVTEESIQVQFKN